MVSKALLNGLNSKLLSRSSEDRFRELGMAGYQWLWDAGTGKVSDLTDRQVANVLQLLVSFRFHGNESDLIQLLEELLGDERVLVRTAAVRLMIALRVIRKEKLTDSERDAVEAALRMGLESNGIADYVRDYLLAPEGS